MCRRSPRAPSLHWPSIAIVTSPVTQSAWWRELTWKEGSVTWACHGCTDGHVDGRPQPWSRPAFSPRLEACVLARTERVLWRLLQCCLQAHQLAMAPGKSAPRRAAVYRSLTPQALRTGRQCLGRGSSWPPQLMALPVHGAMSELGPRLSGSMVGRASLSRRPGHVPRDTCLPLEQIRSGARPAPCEQTCSREQRHVLSWLRAAVFSLVRLTRRPSEGLGGSEVINFKSSS